MLISLNDVKNLWAKYGLRGLSVPSLLNSVAHVGGHYAEELDDYLLGGLQKIDIFEPLQVNCQVIREVMGRLPVWHKEKVKLHEVALGSNTTWVVQRPMYVSSNEAQSSSLLKPTHHSVQYPHITFQEGETVTVMPLDSYKLSPDLLAMDTQGYELEVLKGATETLKSVKVVYTEVSNVPLYEGSALVDDIDEFLQPYGFKRVRTDWVGGTWGDAVYVRIP
jgi:FkbM family methyltransferase